MKYHRRLRKETLFTLYAFDRRPNVSTYTFWVKHSTLRSNEVIFLFVEILSQ